MLMEELGLNSKKKKYKQNFCKKMPNVAGIMTGEITLLSLLINV